MSINQPVQEYDIIRVINFKEDAFILPNQGVPPGLPQGIVRILEGEKWVFDGKNPGFPFDYIADYRIVGKGESK